MFRAKDLAGCVASVVGYFAVLVQDVEVGFYCVLEDVSGHEELDEGFLEDESACGAPAVRGVRGGKTVDGGLGGDGPVAFFGGQAGEFGGD